MSKRNRLGRGLDALFEDSGETSELANEHSEENKVTDDVSEEANADTSAAKDDAVVSEKESSEEAGIVAAEKKPKKTISRKKSSETADTDGRIYVSTALIDASGDQPRTEFDEEKLEELAESIKNYGVLQPLLVTKKNERYEIIAGERRFRAAKMAGLTKVPVVLGDYSRQQSMEIQLIENIQRADLNPIEEAKAYQKLIKEFGLRQEDLAQRVSKNRATITNSMRLLKLDDEVQEMLASGEISSGHARALLAIKDKEAQRALAKKIAGNGLSVRQVEKLVKKMTEKKEEAETEENPDKDRVDMFYQDLADHLKQIMGTKVQIRRKDENRGRIEIEYYSPEELERITELLQSIR